MYCSNCGAKVKEKDNFCHVCGNKLKENVRVDITVDSIPKKDIGDTQVFDFKGKLDGINHNDNIEKIMHTLDEEISREILKHTRPEFSEGLVGSKSKMGDKPKDLEPEKPLKPSVKKEKKKKPEVEKDHVEIPKEEAQKKVLKKSRSLKDIWNSFINEDHDEFSIFANMGESSPKEQKSEIIKTQSTFAGTMESTMPIGIITDDILEDERLKEELQRAEKNLPKKKATKQDIDRAVKNSLEKENFTSNPLEDPPLQNSFYTEVNRKLEESLNSKAAEKKSEKGFFERLRENFSSSKEKKVEKKTETKVEKSKQVDEDPSIFHKINYFLENTIGGLDALGRSGIVYLLIIGAIFSSIPIFVIGRAVEVRYIFLALLKIFLTLCVFYFPLSIAVERSDANPSNERLVFSTVLNWAICSGILLIGFFIYGLMGHRSLLISLSPGIATTLVLYFLSGVIALSLYINDLDKNAEINFIGWYSILFILFELILKLLWLVIDFVA